MYISLSRNLHNFNLHKYHPFSFKLEVFWVNGFSNYNNRVFMIWHI